MVLEDIGLNIDVAPTIASLFGITVPAAARINGRSMEPVLFADASTKLGAEPWHTDFLLKFYAGGRPGAPPARGPYCHHIMMASNNTYAGIRTLGQKYVDFAPYEDMQ